ncbi:MAG: hypothetical protein Q8L41_04020 [Anaerolineales bacterium]|nr:hypothetical protein [Anaerolineales bacterium]
MSGKAQIKAADEDRNWQAGSIEEELKVLVFFAPAEYSNRQ